MAARLRKQHQDEVRFKIQSSQLINRLQNHGLGKNKMTVTQIRAAEVVLRKAVPDLTAIGGSDLMPPVQAAVVVKFGDGRD